MVNIGKRYNHANKQTARILESFKGFFKTVPDKGYGSNQLLWDFSELSYYCSSCDNRIIIGFYSNGYKTLSIKYTVKFFSAINIHNGSNCQIVQPHIEDYLHRFRRWRRKE